MTMKYQAQKVVKYNLPVCSFYQKKSAEGKTPLCARWAGIDFKNYSSA